MPVYKGEMHGRDHCPGGSDPIPCWPGALAFAYATIGNSQVISNNTQTTMTFEHYSISPSNTAIQINTGTPTLPFHIVQGGWYQFWLESEWSGSGFADVRHHGLLISGAGAFDNEDAGSGLTPRAALSDPYHAGVTSSFGPMHIQPPLDIGIQEWQKSGSSQTLLTVHFTIVFLGLAKGVDEGTTSWLDLITAF